MKEFIEYLVKQIVTNTDAVIVNEEKGEEGILNYIINVAKEDMGSLIGKEGRTIKCIRTLAKVKAVKDGVRVNITITEPEDNINNQEDEQN